MNKGKKVNFVLDESSEAAITSRMNGTGLSNGNGKALASENEKLKEEVANLKAEVKDLKNQVSAQPLSTDERIIKLEKDLQTKEEEVFKAQEEREISLFRQDKLKNLALELEDKIISKKEEIKKVKRYAREVTSRSRERKEQI